MTDYPIFFKVSYAELGTKNFKSLSAAMKFAETYVEKVKGKNYNKSFNLNAIKNYCYIYIDMGDDCGLSIEQIKIEFDD